MPYKDKNKANECQRRWYSRNKEKHIASKNLSQQKRIIRYKNKLFKIFGDKCNDCGLSDNRILEWHHLKTRDECVTTLLHSGIGWKKILKEAKKCVLLCPNCHTYRHLKL